MEDLKETLSQVVACVKYISILVAFLAGIKFLDHIFSSTQFYGHWQKFFYKEMGQVPRLLCLVWSCVGAALLIVKSCSVSSVTQSCLTLCDPNGLQYARIPCPSPTPGADSNSCPLSQWCHPTISFSVIPFSSCLQSFPASGSFPMSQFFTSGGQSTGASSSASVLPMNTQDCFPLGDRKSVV